MNTLNSHKLIASQWTWGLWFHSGSVALGPFPTLPSCLFELCIFNHIATKLGAFRGPLSPGALGAVAQLGFQPWAHGYYKVIKTNVGFHHK